MRPGAAAIDRDRDEADAVDERLSEQDRARQADIRRGMRNDCARVLGAAVASAENAMTSGDVADFLDGITDEAFEQGGATDDATKTEWLKGMVGHARQFVAETGALGRAFLEEVRAAKEGQLEGASKARWAAKLKQRKGGEHWNERRDRLKSLLRETLPELKRNWRRQKEEVSTVQRAADRLGVDAAKTPALAFLRTGAFADLTHPQKQAKIEAARRAIEKQSGAREAVLTEAEVFFDAAIAEGVTDAGKKAQALAGLRAEPDTAAAALYVRSTLPARLADWRAEVSRLEGLREKIAAGKLPVQALSRAAFVRKTHGQRSAYLAMLADRVDAAERERGAADREKTVLRKEVEMEDWAGARARLKRIKEKAAERDPELASIEAYLALQPEDADAPDPAKALADLRDQVDGLPEAVKGMYAAAIESDTSGAKTDHATSLAVVLHNAHAQRTGDADEQEAIDRASGEAIIDETAEKPAPMETSIEQPDTAEPAAIDAGENGGLTVRTTEPPEDALESGAAEELIYVEADPDAQRSAYEAIARGTESADFLERVSVRPAIDPASHAELVGKNPKILENVRTLREHGVKFSMAGDAPRSTAA